MPVIEPIMSDILRTKTVLLAADIAWMPRGMPGNSKRQNKSCALAENLALNIQPASIELKKPSMITGNRLTSRNLVIMIISFNSDNEAMR